MNQTLLLIILLTIEQLFGQLQTEDYPIAPEIWSNPELIQEISDFYPSGDVRTVSVTADGKKMFISGIAYLEKTDSGWTKPVFLNDKVNSALAAYPCISPNGKRLFYSRFVGGWFLFYSDWDSSANDWGAPVNCGPGVNRLETTLCAAPDDTTIIYGREGQTYLSVWDSANNTYSEGRGFPDDDNPYYSENGHFITRDFKKIYLELPRTDTLKDGSHYMHEDIVVSYQSDFNPAFYWPSKRLNFCMTLADSLFNEGLYRGKMEGSPTLTGDGKTMYFMADYSGRALIYESHMLVDENGDSVTYVSKEIPKIPNSTELFAPYPNPFNSTTIIRYRLNKRSSIHLSIYDILGKEVIVLDTGYRIAGEYRKNLNASNLSSGLYLIVLKTKKSFLVTKTILLK